MSSTWAGLFLQRNNQEGTGRKSICIIGKNPTPADWGSGCSEQLSLSAAKMLGRLSFCWLKPRWILILRILQVEQPSDWVCYRWILLKSRLRSRMVKSCPLVKKMLKFAVMRLNVNGSMLKIQPLTFALSPGVSNLICQVVEWDCSVDSAVHPGYTILTMTVWLPKSSFTGKIALMPWWRCNGPYELEIDGAVDQ